MNILSLAPKHTGKLDESEVPELPTDAGSYQQAGQLPGRHGRLGRFPRQAADPDPVKWRERCHLRFPLTRMRLSFRQKSCTLRKQPVDDIVIGEQRTVVDRMDVDVAEFSRSADLTPADIFGLPPQ